MLVLGLENLVSIVSLREPQEAAVLIFVPSCCLFQLGMGFGGKDGLMRPDPEDTARSMDMTCFKDTERMLIILMAIPLTPYSEDVLFYQDCALQDYINKKSHSSVALNWLPRTHEPITVILG